MKIYYAHCVSIYNTAQEKRDVQTLQDLGFEVLNPNSTEHANGYKKLGMDYFEFVVKACDALAFRALPDGRIPAGVAQEIEWMLECKNPVIELPSGMISRRIDVDETREYLRELGHR